MSIEIVNQATELFAEKEQWDSFNKLIQNRNDLIENWYSCFREKMNEQFAKNDLVDKWGYVSWARWDYRWYLKEFGQESVCIYYTNNSLTLWANSNNHDLIKLSNLLQEKKYIPITSAFDRQDEINSTTNSFKIVEHGNFYFSDEFDGHLNPEQLAWYAKYKTTEFVMQLTEKVNKFRKNSEITELLIELNSLTKIK